MEKIIKISNTKIRGKKAIIFPLQVTMGYVADQQGHHILDIRGWGFLQYADDDKGAELQDGIANWVVETLNKRYEELQSNPLS